MKIASRRKIKVPKPTGRSYRSVDAMVRGERRVARNALRDRVAALLLKLDQAHPTAALWNSAGVDYYDAADQLIRLIKRA